MALLVALVATGGGAVYAYSSYQDGAGPDGAVRAYFQALARGDAPAALAAGQVPSGSRAYLTSAVLRQQLDVAPIRNITIVSSDRTGDHAKVAYSYDLGFAAGTLKVSDTIGVTLTGSRWRLDTVAVAGTYFLNQAVERGSFAETEVPQGLTSLFPGAVPITFDTPYLRLSLATEMVRLGDTGAIELDAQLTGAATTILRAHLQSLLNACVKGASAPVSCPLPIGQFVPGSLNGRVALDKSSLVMDMNLDPVGSVAITGSATFTGKYRELAFDNVGTNHTGSLSLPIIAKAYVVAPLTVRFQDVS